MDDHHWQGSTPSDSTISSRIMNDYWKSLWSYLLSCTLPASGDTWALLRSGVESRQDFEYCLRTLHCYQPSLKTTGDSLARQPPRSYLFANSGRPLSSAIPSPISLNHSNHSIETSLFISEAQTFHDNAGRWPMFLFATTSRKSSFSNTPADSASPPSIPTLRTLLSPLHSVFPLIATPQLKPIQSPNTPSLAATRDKPTCGLYSESIASCCLWYGRA